MSLSFPELNSHLFKSPDTICGAVGSTEYGGTFQLEVMTDLREGQEQVVEVIECVDTETEAVGREISELRRRTDAFEGPAGDDDR